MGYMDETTQTKVDYSAILDTIMYGTDTVDIPQNSTLEDVLDIMEKSPFGKEKADLLRETFIKYPELKQATIISQSHQDGQELLSTSGSQAKQDSIQACAFKVGDDIYVSYRGTGDGRWGDNGEGFTQENTEMQEDARKYFDYVVKKYGLDSSVGNIYVTGHSKGGNEAQYVMMTSKYNYLIEGCYSIDGQGFSKAAIKKFIEINGEDGYNELLQKMYSINCENDYVHPLINPIILKDNTYYVSQVDSEKNPHDIFAILGKTGLTFMTDGENRVVNGTPGALPQYVMKVMEYVRVLPENVQGEMAMAVMAILEKYVGSGEWTGMDGAGADISNFLELAKWGIPVVLLSGGEFIISQIYEEYGMVGVVAAAIISTAAAVVAVSLFGGVLAAAAKFALDIYAVILLLDAVADIIKAVKRLCQIGGEIFGAIINFLGDVLKNLREWCYKNSYGYKQAVSDPYFEVDTGLMANQAVRLRKLSERAKKLDRDMNCLYRELDFDWSTLPNLAKLLNCGTVLEFAHRLDSCASYLSDTADDMNRIEREIAGTFG